MADVNPQAILAATPSPGQNNPLAMITQFADFANKMQQNKLMQQEQKNLQTTNQRGQQELATTMANRHAQILASLSNLPDAALQGGKPLYDALNAEVASGQIDPERAAVFKTAIDHATMSGGAQNGAAYRPLLSSLLLSTMSGPQVIAAQTPNLHQVDIGGQIVPMETPSALSLMNNPNQGVSIQPGAVNRTLAPGYVNAGNAAIPVGGANGQPVVGMGVSPAQANEITTVIDPNTGLAVTGRQYQFGGMVGAGPAGAGVQGGGPHAAPEGGFRLPGAGGSQAPQGGSPTAGGGGSGQGAGLLSGGPVATNKQALENQQVNFQNFVEARNQMPDLKRNEQTLVRIDNELKSVTTGPGTDTLQTLRNYVSTLNGLTGGKINPNDIASGNYDELGKDFNQLVSQSGNPQLKSMAEALTHGNPNLLMNRIANSNVTAIFLGQNRQKQMEVLLTKDATSGRDFQQARQEAAQLDPRALAFDVIARNPAARNELQKELQQNPKEAETFYRSLALAKSHGLFNYGPGVNAPSAGVAPQNNLQQGGNPLSQ